MLYQLSYGRQLPAGVAEKGDRFKQIAFHRQPGPTVTDLRSLATPRPLPAGSRSAGCESG